jgi:hypothetical protein
MIDGQTHLAHHRGDFRVSCCNRVRTDVICLWCVPQEGAAGSEAVPFMAQVATAFARGCSVQRS